MNRPPHVLWLVAIVLIAVTVAVFAPAIEHEFLRFDDGEYVVDNPHVTGGLTGSNIVWAFMIYSPIFFLSMQDTGSEANATQFPLTYPFLEPISPLKFPFDGIDLLFETARFNLPVPIGPMAQVGATAPGTLAGTSWP